MKDNAQRQREFKERQRKLGRVRIEFWVNQRERKVLREWLRLLRAK